MRELVAVFIVPEFHVHKAAGGAENICRLVVLGLSSVYNVMVLHGEMNMNRRLGYVTEHTTTVRSMNAFYVDSWIREHGEVAPELCPEADNILTRCVILISFERVLHFSNSELKQLCVLGGISYPHCIDVARSQLWDRLIVPSSFLLKRCHPLRMDGRITIIPNGVPCNQFHSLNQDRTHVALLPFRPDERKGYWASIDFIAQVNCQVEWGHYTLLITRQLRSNFAEESFYNMIEAFAREKNVMLRYVPWQPQEQMNKLYQMCDFVLALGDLEEGFGLTTIECILAGRYVISRRIGATATLLPENHGVIFLESDRHGNGVIKTMHQYERARANQEAELGSKYIRAHYDVSTMQQRFLTVVREEIGGKA